VTVLPKIRELDEVAASDVEVRSPAGRDAGIRQEVRKEEFEKVGVMPRDDGCEIGTERLCSSESLKLKLCKDVIVAESVKGTLIADEASSENAYEVVTGAGTTAEGPWTPLYSTEAGSGPCTTSTPLQKSPDR